MFLFQISSYDDEHLDAETEELLRQRLEAYSRQRVPGIWNAVDRLNARSGKGPGRESRRVRYRIYGVFLVILGVVVLVPGLMEPRNPAFIWAGGFAVFAGMVNFCLVRERKAPLLPASCRKEAKALLEERRAIDWLQNRGTVRFDAAGMTVCSGKTQKTLSYDKLSGILETEHLWLLTCEGERALLLQKKDLTKGEADAFSLHILQKMGARH